MRALRWTTLLLILIASIASAGTATITWHAPTTSVDGSPLTDLAGHRLYYGTTAGWYPTMLDVGVATSAALDDLDPGYTYYFVVTAYDTTGNEGPMSVEVQKTIPLPPPADTQAPVVAITQPKNGATVPAGAYVMIGVTATDNVGVMQTKLFLNGKQLCISSQASWTCRWKVPTTKGGTYKLIAHSWDAAGNQGISPTVSVTAK